MSRNAVEKTFEALFALTDLRQIFRDTKPEYRLNDEKREEIRRILGTVRECVDVIEREMIER